MANVSVYNMEGKEVGKIDLNDAIFGVEVNEHLVHMAVLQQLADKRQGTQKAKEAEESLGDRREQVTQDRDLSELLSGRAAELYSLRFQEITLSR